MGPERLPAGGPRLGVWYPRPAYHWFLPGYPLLGALFVRITPAQPFLWPDLACLLASLWLFTGLAARLLGHVPYARSIGAVVFAATTALPQKAMLAWVIPWTTTPEAVCLFACLLAAARFTKRPRPLDAFAAALAGVAAAGFRPADSAVVVAVSGAVMGWVLWRQWPGWRPGLRIGAAALAGAAIPVLVFGGAYLATIGWRASGYVTLSRSLGFEWRLLPLRWVTLMIDPKPLFPEGRGLAAVFPWIVPGLAGMAASLAAPSGVPRRLHVLVIGATLLDCVMFLIYRDLNPVGLWRFGNYHYFKWTLPAFGLYAVLLPRALLPLRLPACAAAAASLLALFMWRVELTGAEPLPLATGANRLSLPAGLPHLDDVLLAAGTGTQQSLYLGGSYIHAGGGTFESHYDFKVFAWAHAFAIMPQRPLPDAPSTLDLASGGTLDQTVPPLLAHQTLVWGLPCWFGHERPGCQPRVLLPPRTLPLNEAVAFGASGADEDYIVAGWSVAEPGGRWTDGGRATLRIGLPLLPPGSTPILALTAQGFTPEGGEPIRVTAMAHGIGLARWRFGAQPETVRMTLPAAAGAMTLDLVVDNPRQALPDVRELGVLVHSIELTADHGG